MVDLLSGKIWRKKTKKQTKLLLHKLWKESGKEFMR